jgi:hypothetical protein
MHIIGRQRAGRAAAASRNHLLHVTSHLVVAAANDDIAAASAPNNESMLWPQLRETARAMTDEEEAGVAVGAKRLERHGRRAAAASQLSTCQRKTAMALLCSKNIYAAIWRSAKHRRKISIALRLFAAKAAVA